MNVPHKLNWPVSVMFHSFKSTCQRRISKVGVSQRVSNLQVTHHSGLARNKIDPSCPHFVSLTHLDFNTSLKYFQSSPDA